MIQVSNEFKKAIKKQERQIKGYVEILYDLSNITVTPTTNITSTYTPLAEICNGVRVENLYGSLDYLPLNGVYLTMDNNVNTNAGFISDDLFENLTTPTVTLSFSSMTVKGITLYFRENIPTNLTLNYSDGSSSTIINENEIVQIIFENSKTLTNVQVVINDMMYQDRKIYLMEIDLGITQVYKDQDLIEFTIDEEVNKLVEEVPINEINITLNNMNDLFNPLNPTGIVPYLSENTLIKPYIGVLTDTLGVEYVKMGEFYFDSYINNSDSTTALVGGNLLKRLEEETMKDDNETDFFRTAMAKQYFDSFMNNYNYDYVTNWTRNIGPVLWNDTSLLKFLKDTAFYQENLFYVNRNNIIIFRDIDKEIKDSLTKNELLKDADFKYIEKINTLKIPKNTRTQDISNQNSSQILKETVTLSKSPEIFSFISNSPDLMFANVSQSGGTSASIVTAGFHMAFVKVTGTVGENVTLTFTATNKGSVSKTEFVKTNKGNSKEKSIVFDSPIYYVFNQNILNGFNFLEKTPQYQINFEYIGDPSLEAGDYISVQTPYGYKSLFIQKNRFKFDGGLSGSIEGVE